MRHHRAHYDVIVMFLEFQKTKLTALRGSHVGDRGNSRESPPENQFTYYGHPLYYFSLSKQAGFQMYVLDKSDIMAEFK